MKHEITVALPPVTYRSIGDTVINSVDGRKIHEYLGIATDYSTWVRRRIVELELVEDRDFAVFSRSPNLGNAESGGFRTAIDYAFTIRAAKHLVMVERNDAGFALREYFLDVEERAKTQDPLALLGDPNVLRGLLGSYAERVIALEAEVSTQASEINTLRDEVQESQDVIEAMAPKAEAYDEFIDSEGAYTLSNAARCLEIPVMTLTHSLRCADILMSKGSNYNLPKADYLQREYFAVRVHTVQRGVVSHARSQTYVTPKGLAWLIKCINSGRIPLVKPSRTSRTH